MCGIFGFTAPGSESILKKMGEALTHRGPDDDGYYSDKFISLGMRRLSIVDLHTGYQPVTNEDNSIITVCNGEIYNYQTLRKELQEKGHFFHRNHSDIETIVHLYEQYRHGWAQKVNGMFGTAIWDKKNHELSLYRDRIGKKPIYYSLINGDIIFASEIKSILSFPGINTDLDNTTLYHYFSNKNISAPKTCYRHIKELMPGNVLIWKNGNITIKPYWQISFKNTTNDYTEEEIAEQLYQLYVDSIKLRINCDVPYGAYLSGGIDSSSIVAIMSKLSSTPTKTFCLGYEEKESGQFKGKQQDIFHAQKMAKFLGTEHYELIINSKDFTEQIPEILHSLDEPFSGTISTFFLSQLIKKHVKVALSGDGADELFGSYLSHRLAIPISNFFAQGLSKKTSFSNLTDHQISLLIPFNNKQQFSFLKKIASVNLPEWRNNLSVFNTIEKSELLSDDFLSSININDINSNIYQNLFSTLTSDNLLDNNLEIDQKELLPNQVLKFVDRLSMAHSIEVRCPFLDYRVIEFANSIPAKYKINGKVVKAIHKKALSELLPKEIIDRPKEGFVQPVYTWMHSSIKSFVLDAIYTLPRDLFRADYLAMLTKSYVNGDISVNAKIWNLTCFSLWWNLK